MSKRETAHKMGQRGEKPTAVPFVPRREPPRKAHVGFGRASTSGEGFEVGLEEQAAHGDRRALLAKEPCVWGMVRPSRWAGVRGTEEACGGLCGAGRGVDSHAVEGEAS